MIKYKDIHLYNDIDNVKLEYLLEATPYTKAPQKSFSGKLTEDIFHERLFVPSKTDDRSPDEIEEINHFNLAVGNFVNELSNEHERVVLTNIRGYGGSGKTTFIHQLVRTSILPTMNCKIHWIDYENASNAIVPLLKIAVDYIGSEDTQKRYEYLSSVANEQLFVIDQFYTVREKLKLLSDSIRSVYLTKNAKGKCSISKMQIREIISGMEKEFNKTKDFLSFLLTIIFLFSIYERFQNTQANTEPILYIIDNIDSMDPIEEETKTMHALNTFLNKCHMFIAENLDNDTLYNNHPISDVFSKSKYVFFLITRIITARRYHDLLIRGAEENDLWNEFEFPANYYDHKEIIKAKVQFYTKLEGSKPSGKISMLKNINNIASYVYSSAYFPKLFNGNIRYCFTTLRHIAKNKDLEQLLQKCDELKSSNEWEGYNGIVLNIILRYFKDKSIFESKLHLSDCIRDGKVSCSRLILTLLRESDNGTCSLRQLLDYLFPTFSKEEICQTILDMSEAERKIWRRMVTFDKVIPPDDDEAMPTGAELFHDQLELYDQKIYQDDKYSNIVICQGGITYLEFVVPHFEFLLNRHEKSRKNTQTIHKPPLFMIDDISNKKTDKSGKKVYSFELPIETVFHDVYDCLYNSQQVANELIANQSSIQSDSFRNTPYNYRPIRNDIHSERQTYIARLIFRHVGYLDKYRIYLLKTHKKESPETKRNVNQCLVEWITKYLNMYAGLDSNLRNTEQNKALKVLLDQIEIIKHANYSDFNTKIEVGQNANK